MATSSTRKKTPAKKAVTVTKKLPPNPFVHEILELVSKQRTINKKVEILKEYRNDALTAVLIWNFDDSVISLLPQGEVRTPRQPDAEGDGQRPVPGGHPRHRRLCPVVR